MKICPQCHMRFPDPGPDHCPFCRERLPEDYSSNPLGVALIVTLAAVVTAVAIYLLAS